MKRYLARASSGEKEPLRPLLGQEAWAASGQKFTWFRCAILDQNFCWDFFTNIRYDLDGHTEKDDSKAPLWTKKKKAKHLFELPATKCRSLSCLGCLCLIIMIVIIIILSD